MRERGHFRAGAALLLATAAVGCHETPEAETAFGVSICDVPWADPGRFDFSYSVSELALADAAGTPIEVTEVEIPRLSGDTPSHVLLNRFGLRMRVNGDYWCRAALGGETPLSWFADNWEEPGDREFDTPLTVSQSLSLEAIEEFDCPTGTATIEVTAQPLAIAAPEEPVVRCLAGGLDAFTYRPEITHAIGAWETYRISLRPTAVLNEQERPEEELILVSQRPTNQAADQLDLAAIPTSYYLRLTLIRGEEERACDISRSVYPDRLDLPLLENNIFLDTGAPDPCPVEDYTWFDWRAFAKPMRPYSGYFN